MPKHTPEPWWIDDDGFVAAGGGDSYTTVADTHNTYDLNKDANAARIVACVNACEGINPDAVSDLLAALVAVNALLNDPSAEPDQADLVLMDVDNAIAKATGGE